MTFLVSVETQGRGSYVLGFINIEEKQTPKKTRQSAQNVIVEALVTAGFPKEQIGIQVTDNTSLEINNHRVLIAPVQEFNNGSALCLAELLKR